MTYEHTNGSNQDFVSLCHELDAYLNHIVGGEENRTQYIPYNSPDGIHDVFVAYDGDIAIGCAAFKRYDDKTAEVKRVFIREEYRGQGISKKTDEIVRADSEGTRVFRFDLRVRGNSDRSYGALQKNRL